MLAAGAPRQAPIPATATAARLAAPCCARPPAGPAQVLRDSARLQGRPVAVVQYNPYGDLKSLAPDDDRLLPHSNGSLIAVGYEARCVYICVCVRGGEGNAHGW